VSFVVLSSYILCCISVESGRLTAYFSLRRSIPLNDEFLTAFGKREKEYDELMGRSVDIDKTSLDVVDVYDSNEDGDEDSNTRSNVSYSAITIGKVIQALDISLPFNHCSDLTQNLQ
jgi:hypothetical protein